MSERRIVTAVIGAGPAGLLFCIISRLLFARQGGDLASWPIYLFDKREQYQRTHRLRISPEAYRLIQTRLRDPLFDKFMDFLEEESFKPAVNLLEDHMQTLTGQLGIYKEIMCIGKGPGETSLPGLRLKLEKEGRLQPGGLLTIIAADSVHSTIRDIVRGKHEPVKHTHQTVARLRVVGSGIPKQLGMVKQYKLAKVLHSLLDYRMNQNGFAEIDLFLEHREHKRLEKLGSSPKEPVLLTDEIMKNLKAPFFERFVYHLRKDIAPGPCDVLLQSTFRLEHQYMEKQTFILPELNARVFLLGDAAISLPFFRGMACLAGSAWNLAQVHCDLAAVTSRLPSLSKELEADIQGNFMTREHARHFGTKLIPGKILRVEPTVYNGVVAYVLLHYWLTRYGVHILYRTGNNWHSLHHLAPVGRLTALSDFAACVDPVLRYDLEQAKTRSSEISTVRARALLVRFAREFCRISTFLPFPVQTWFLSFPEPNRGPGHLTAGFVFNSGTALLAAGAALGGPLLAELVKPVYGWLWPMSLIIQALGGIAFRAAQEFEPVSHSGIQNVWRIQVAVLFLAGVGITVALSIFRDQPVQLHSSLSWLILAGFFVAGLYLFEWLDRYLFSHASFEESEI